MFETRIDDELRLRTLCEDDAETLFRVVDGNRAHLREWLPWLDANTTSKDSLAFIQATLRQEAANQGFTCAVEFLGRIVGVAGYHPIRWNNKSVEIGYWLAREAVGHGIMTKCCRVLVSHAFAEYGLNRVQIPAAVGNRRSRAIPERLGFQMEGIIRDAEWLYDHFVDHAMYAMLKKDWNGEQGGGYSPSAAVAEPHTLNVNKEMNMNEQANDTLKTIHSLRTTHGDFSDRDVSDRDLETILAAAVRAANASNAQNYAIIVIRDRAVMKEVSGGYSGAVALLFCVDFQRNMDLAAHVGKVYEYDPAWALTTGTVDAALAAQTAAIAAQSLGIDSLLTNGIHRGDPRRVWKALNLPSQNCFSAVMLVLGYGKSSPTGHAGRLAAQGTIHQETYHRRNAAELAQLATFQSDAANHLWEPNGFFDGPGKRAKTAYAQLAPTLAEAGFALPAAPMRKE